MEAPIAETSTAATKSLLVLIAESRLGGAFDDAALAEALQASD
jgi:hypothetical protein